MHGATNEKFPPKVLCPGLTPTSWLEITRAQKAHAECAEEIATTANHLCDVKVHTELQVALLLLSEQPTTIRSSPAPIGVSKLSCGPCNISPKALNKAREAHCAVRTTHAKWYPGWGMPSDQVLTTVLTAEELVTLKECLVKKMTKQIFSFITAIDIQNVRISDSTDASLDGGYTMPQEWRVARAYQLLTENDGQEKVTEPAFHDAEASSLSP